MAFVPFSLNTDVKAEAKKEKKELCYYRFSLPPQTLLLSQKQDLFIAKTKYASLRNPIEVQWLFSCADNLRRTSQSSEILRKSRKEKELLHHHESFSLDQGVEALLLSRTRIKKGYPLRSIEAYFATRNYEYHFYALMKGKKTIQIKKKIHSEFLGQMKKILSDAKFSKKMEKTITEEEFQVRLYAATALFLVIGLFAVFMLFWRVYRRKRKKKQPF